MKHRTTCKLSRALRMPKLPVCDPIYGIRYERITERITPENWEDKALWRMAIGGPVYVYLLHRYTDPEDDDTCVYIVSATLYDYESNRLGSFSDRFDDLESALKYANGDDRTPLGVLTRNASPEEYPRECSPPMFLATPT